MAEEFSGGGRRDAARSPFERYADNDLVDLIQEYPLAWVCSRHASLVLSSLLPLLVETDAQGRPQSLLGHMARSNPLFKALTLEPQVMILFNGPQGYVSPACVSDRNWAPTWNYAQIRMEATLRFDEAETEESLARLLAAMEAREPTGWTVDSLGERYGSMVGAVVAFRAVITQSQATFKLGQDEKPARLQEILSRHGDPDLVRWMRRFNADRVNLSG